MMSIEGELRGKIALVTGAGRKDGIGWAAAVALAKAGATVIATGYGRIPLATRIDLGSIACYYHEARSEQAIDEDLNALAAQLKTLSPESRSEPLDVTSTAEVCALCDEIAIDHGGVDILFNNAGVAFGAGAFLELTEDQWRTSFEVNLHGTINMCRSVIPAMQARGGGSIINNASIAGLRANAYLAPYSASKFALIGLTQSLAAEFGGASIRVNAICPGAIQTRMGDLEYSFAGDLMGGGKADAIAHIVNGIPLQRLGHPDEIAKAVVFLASDSSSYITGAAIPITGGQV